LTGELQLRARRTRIKILRAIADKEGSACFSEIRNATGLSTGSIYYHLERMVNYVSKDSKHYTITDEGLHMLRELDTKFSSQPSHNECENPLNTREPRLKLKQIGPMAAIVSEYSPVLVLCLIVTIVPVGLLENLHMVFPKLSTAPDMITNASLISSISSAALLSFSFLVMLKRQLLPRGFMGIMISALTILGVLLVNILIFSGLGTQIGANYSTS
jgi:regulatory ArsR family protein